MRRSMFRQFHKNQTFILIRKSLYILVSEMVGRRDTSSKGSKHKQHENQDYKRHSHQLNVDSNASKYASPNEELEEIDRNNKATTQSKANHDYQDMKTDDTQMKVGQDEKSTQNNDENSRFKKRDAVPFQGRVKANPKTNLNTYVENFLQQRSAFTWLTQQFDRLVGSDHFNNQVVRSTFPVNLDESDFAYYIDMTFNDFPSELKIRMKNLFQETHKNPIAENFTIETISDGSVSATLVQILSHRNECNNLEMIVGSVTLTRRPHKNYRFNPLFLEQHREQVKKALQYLYGKEALKELS